MHTIQFPPTRNRNHPMRLTRLLLALATLLPIAPVGHTTYATDASQATQLPPNFKLETFASGLKTPRLLSFSPEGDLYVAEYNGDPDTVRVLPDRNHDGRVDESIIFASGLDNPNGIAFRGGSVYVGEWGRVLRLTDTNGDLRADTREVFIDNLPADGRHRTKSIAFGPDGKFYMNIGSFTDNGLEEPGRAAIWQYNADGTGGRVYARGLRNVVGFDWDPLSGLMWGVENGADDLGDDQPPDELNQIVDGGDYGFPRCMGDKQVSPTFPGSDCSRTLGPAATFPAHSAPLGMTFYTGASFPQQYWGGAFVALHSIQYVQHRQIAFVPFKDGKPSGAAQRFLDDGEAWLGVAVSPYDGSLFASLDRRGTIHRISYTGAQPAPTELSGPPPPSGAGKPKPVPAVILPGMLRCFAETKKCLRGAFLNYWFTHGGVEQFGFPLTGELTERLSDGKSYTVQYTERARFEWHPENRGKESQVLLGRLGADLAVPRASETPFKPVARCAGCGLLYFEETKHHVAAELRAYWQNNGSVPVFGYPLSEPFMERSPTDGKQYLVQYFERNRLEYHPENKGTRFEVLLGLLGVQTYEGRYGAKP